MQGLPGQCARVAGAMCKGAKVKSTPSPRPETGVRHKNFNKDCIVPNFVMQQQYNFVAQFITYIYVS